MSYSFGTEDPSLLFIVLLGAVRQENIHDMRPFYNFKLTPISWSEGASAPALGL